MNHQNSDRLSEWNPVLTLSCSTVQTVKIKSYGDWDFSLSSNQANKVVRSIQQIIKEDQIGNYCDQDENVQIQVKSFPFITNIKDSWHKIWVQVQYSEQEFKQKYGFWKISDFKIYDQNGNGSMSSFFANNIFYIGSYDTS